MEKKTYRSVCPLDCFDSCGLLVQVEAGTVVGVEGDPLHPVTKGFICSKGRGLRDRLYSPDRVLHPMRRQQGGWRRISWEEALEEIADKLREIRERWGTTALLHLYDYGSKGALKALDQRFFNAYGGVSVPVGSLCWGSGLAAQTYDFGAVRAHRWEDLMNSRTILLWGRDPAATNIHLVTYLKAAQEKGAQVIVINPLRTKSAEIFDKHVAVRPGTDGALALGMAHEIFSRGWADLEFVKKHVEGWEEFARLVAAYTPEKVADITDVPADEIRELARRYALSKPSAIVLGYGLQRYANGGQTVRAIDALGAITGNIGVAGGGVNYGASDNFSGLLADIKGQELARQRRELARPIMGREILEESDPPIQGIFVTRSNPLCQMPHTAVMLEAFHRVPFIVVIDHYLTDTAEEADIFLPCATAFEEEDLVVSGNGYLAYGPKVAEPQGEARSEVTIFTELAKDLGLGQYFDLSSEEWLKVLLAPAEEKGISLERLRRGPAANPLHPAVAWADKVFATPSGKVELFSHRAQQEGLNPLPGYQAPRETPSWEEPGEEYPLYLITAHHPRAIHSQFQDTAQGDHSFMQVEIHPQLAETKNIRSGEAVQVESPWGEVRGVALLTDRLREDVIQIYQGRWIKDGGGVNFLTPDFLPDMGMGTPYYDCRVRVVKLPIDV